MDVKAGRRRVFERIVYPDPTASTKSVFQRITRASRKSVFERIAPASRKSVFERITLPSRNSVFRRLVYPSDEVIPISGSWVEEKCNENPCRFLHSQPHQPLPLQSELRRKRLIYDIYDSDDLGEMLICKRRPVTIMKNDEVLDAIVAKSDEVTEVVVNSYLDNLTSNSIKKLTDISKIQDSDDAVAKSAEGVVNSREPQMQPFNFKSVNENSEVIVKKDEDWMGDSLKLVVLNFDLDSLNSTKKLIDISKIEDAIAKSAEGVVKSREPQIQPSNSDFAGKNFDVIIKNDEDWRVDSLKLTEVVNSQLNPQPQTEQSKCSSVYQNCKAAKCSYDYQNYIKGMKNDDTTQLTGKKNVCDYWLNSSCADGEKCRDLHSWFTTTGFSCLANLKRWHKKTVTGVCFPSGSDKLLSVSEDGTLCSWDSSSGQCINFVDIACEIRCLMAEGSWIFVGHEKGVHAWNMEAKTELILDGANGVVRCLAGADDMLFGGSEGGSIAVWKNTLVATLESHQQAVLCLTVRAGCLYSASKDATIRLWDVKTLKCLYLLNAHAAPVTSILCWGNYLISGSLDNTIKMWAISEDGSMQVAHQVDEDVGVLAMSLIHNAILLCSCADNTIHLYNLPLFTKMGTIFSKEAVNAVAGGCSGLFFTGDHSGQLDVWQFHGQPSDL